MRIEARRRTRIALSLVALGSLSLLGCGQEEGGATVSGRVTYQGKPLAKGSITFVPRGAPAATAKIREDGSYTLLGPNESEHIAPAAYDIVIMGDLSAHQGNDALRAKMGFGVPLSVMRLATTPLHYDVVEGPNSIDVNLDDIPDPAAAKKK